MKNYEDNCDDIDEKKVAWKVLKVIGMVLLGILAGAFFGFVIMWLWNWLMPMIFDLTTLTYWQAVGLFILAKIIFGGFSGGSDSASKKKKGEKGTIRHTIKSEIKREFDKEFDKDQEKARAKKAAKNGDVVEEAEEVADSKSYDDMYESWWEKEGEKNFEQYMKDKQE